MATKEYAEAEKKLQYQNNWLESIPTETDFLDADTRWQLLEEARKEHEREMQVATAVAGTDFTNNDDYSQGIEMEMIIDDNPPLEDMDVEDSENPEKAVDWIPLTQEDRLDTKAAYKTWYDFRARKTKYLEEREKTESPEARQK